MNTATKTICLLVKLALAIVLLPIAVFVLLYTSHKLEKLYEAGYHWMNKEELHRRMDDIAKTQDFDYRSNAKALYDKMKKELEEDGLAESMADELKALEKALEMDKEKFVRLKKDEIIPFIEEELAVRYWFQEAGIKVRLRYDEQLKKCLE